MRVSRGAVGWAVGPDACDREHDATSRAETGYGRCVHGRPTLAIARMAGAHRPGNGPACDVDPVLDRERDSLQGTGLPSPQAPVGRVGIGETALGVDRRHSADHRPESIEAVEQFTDDLDGRALALS